MALELAHPNPRNGVVRALDQNEVGSLTCRQDVLSEVWAVDGVPDLPSHLLGSLVGQRRIPAEVGLRLLEGRGPQQKKALDVPTAGIVVRRGDGNAGVGKSGDGDRRGTAWARFGGNSP